MALLVGFLQRRSICRNFGGNLQLLQKVSLSSRSLFNRELMLGSPSASSRLGDRKVAVFWDLDNKPPKHVPPFKAAMRLKEVAAEFGYVEDVVAYANYHAFNHVPGWVQEERKQRKLLDELEEKGVVEPEAPYVCGVCGAKKKTNVDLKRHFKMLHEREQSKRLNRLNSLKGKKKQKKIFWNTYGDKVDKYKVAERDVLIPKFGYRLEQDLRKAGVFVRTVKDEPQAADIALKQHMRKSISNGIKCICLVSDDSDFSDVMKEARSLSLRTIVIGDLRVLTRYADAYFSWADVVSGMAKEKAKLLIRHWTGENMEELGSVFKSDLHPCSWESQHFPLEDSNTSECESDNDSDWGPSDTVDGRHEKDDFYNSIFDSSGSDSDT